MAQTNENRSDDKTASHDLVITVDYDRYAEFLSDENDMSEEEKLKFMQALWETMLQLAVYGVRFEGAITDDTPCGQDGTDPKNRTSSAPNAVNSSYQEIASKFQTACASGSTSAVEEAGP